MCRNFKNGINELSKIKNVSLNKLNLVILNLFFVTIQHLEHTTKHIS
jgi:hypothetical protein